MTLAGLLSVPVVVFSQPLASPVTATASSATASTSTPRPLAAPQKAEASRTGASRSKIAVESTGPAWSELTPTQQQSLKPLAATWNTIGEGQKRKWLQISKNYVSLSPADRATLDGRMNEWASMSALQRAQARLNFAKTKELSKQLTPEEKKEKWQTYQALSAEEKTRLAQKAAPRPLGAAIAVKPVAAQKLVALPPHHPASTASRAHAMPAVTPKIAATTAASPASAAAPVLPAPASVKPAS